MDETYALATGILVVYMVIVLAVAVISLVGMWKIFVKAGRSGGSPDAGRPGGSGAGRSVRSTGGRSCSRDRAGKQYGCRGEEVVRVFGQQKERRNPVGTDQKGYRRFPG